jgi:hypothetical protein
LLLLTFRSKEGQAFDLPQLIKARDKKKISCLPLIDGYHNDKGYI